MKWPSAVALVLALGPGVLAPMPARAWTEYLAMDALPEDSGWTPIVDDYPVSSSTVSDGILTLACHQFREYKAPASWLGTVDAAAGYRIEFRMRILISDRCYAQREIGVWYHDRTIGTIPLFTIAGTLLGGTLSFLSVYRQLVRDKDVDEDGPAKS